jgi:hypothetical protein
MGPNLDRGGFGGRNVSDMLSDDTRLVDLLIVHRRHWLAGRRQVKDEAALTSLSSLCLRIAGLAGLTLDIRRLSGIRGSGQLDNQSVLQCQGMK